MKIGFVSVFAPSKDGIADYSLHLIRSIENTSSDCIFYVMAPLIDDKQSVVRVSQRVTVLRIWRMRSLKDMLQSIIFLLRAIIVTNVDILHIQYRFTREQGGSAGEPFLILMLITKRMLRKKIVISLHDFWLPNEAEQRASELIRSKLLAKLYKYYYALYVRAVLSIPNLILSIVNSKKSPVTQLIKKYTKQEVVEVLHGLPQLDLPAKRRKVAASVGKSGGGFDANDRFTVILYGFIRRSKGYDYVIKAMEKIVTSQPDMRARIRLVIAGTIASSEEEPYLNYLKRLAAELRIDDLVSISERYLDAEEVNSVFSNAGAIVIPYTRRVGPSGVLASALAYEVPAVITSDNKYITHDMHLPCLTVNLNEDEIASAILKLMTDKHEYERQVRLIREYKELQNNEDIAMSHVELYRKLLSTNNRAKTARTNRGSSDL